MGEQAVEDQHIGEQNVTSQQIAEPPLAEQQTGEQTIMNVQLSQSMVHTQDTPLEEVLLADIRLKRERFLAGIEGRLAKRQLDEGASDPARQ